MSKRMRIRADDGRAETCRAPAEVAISLRNATWEECMRVISLPRLCAIRKRQHRRVRQPTGISLSVIQITTCRDACRIPGYQLMWRI